MRNKTPQRKSPATQTNKNTRASLPPSTSRTKKDSSNKRLETRHIPASWRRRGQKRGAAEAQVRRRAAHEENEESCAGQGRVAALERPGARRLTGGTVQGLVNDWEDWGLT